MQEQTIFTEALEKADPTERAAFLDDACAGDQALRERIERLLQRHEQAGSFLNAPSASSPEGTVDPITERPGTIIGPYKLLEQIGAGGFGVVFMAEQLQPIRRKVALKLLKPGMDSGQVVARFEAERQALALMDHPNIARVIDGGETATGRPYFVMELVKGVSITKYCDEQRLSPRERLALFVPVCEAVQHAHQKGIIHRDIKPSNVLVAAYDGRPAPKVIDFGVAKAMGQQLTDRTLVTNFGGIIGTLEYMSPEQAEFNALDIDTRADIYGLGVLLYELLTGTTPLTRQRVKEAAILEVLRLIREEEPPTPSTRLSASKESLASISAHRKLEPAGLTKAVRGELDWIVMKCLEKDRIRRYETATGLAHDIQRYLNGEPVDAAPPSTSYKLRKLARKHRKLLGAAGAFGLLLAVGTAVSTWQAVRATQAEHDAVAAKERADEEAAIARAVNDFLQKDLLGQADTANQAPGAQRNKDITVRELLDRAAAGVDGKFSGQELTEAAIRDTLGKAYIALGEYSQAQQHLEKSRDLRKKKFGTDHRDTLDSTNNLASLCWERGQYGEAETLYKQVLEGLTAKLGSDHVDTLLIVSNLAMLDSHRGRFDEAERGFKRVADGLRAQLGAGHLKTLQGMSNLATLHMRRGRYAEAEPISKQVVEGISARLGADHPKVLHSLNNLATLYMRWKRYDEAEPLFKQVLSVRTVQLGADHPDTLTTMNDLAVVYQETQRYDDAEPLFRQALESSRVKPGAQHALTLKIMNCLATLCAQRKKYDEAEKLFGQVLEIRRAVLGADHPETLLSLGNLGTYFLNRDAYDKAEPLLREAAAGAHKKLGQDHPLTQLFMKNLAEVQSKLPAEKAQKKCHTIVGGSVKGRVRQVRADAPNYPSPNGASVLT